MKTIEIRVPLGLGSRLIDAVRRPGREHVAFGLLAQSETSTKTLLLVRDVLLLPDNAYLDDPRVGAAWSGMAMLPIMAAAESAGCGIVVFHIHDHTGPPRLSPPDLASAKRLLPLWQRRVTARVHGSVVLSSNDASGVLLGPSGSFVEVNPRMRWLGSSILEGGFRPERTDSSSADDGALVATDALRPWRVAVVGLSGGGSHVVQQLARLGVGTILGVDDDRLEPRNSHKIVGLPHEDLMRRRRKTEAMADVVRVAGTGSTFEGIPFRVPSPEAVSALKTADVIVGCLDNLHARADLQEIAWRSLIPYVDVGVSIRALSPALLADPATTIGGNIATLIPGGFCLWCAGVLSDNKLEEELGGAPNRSYFQNRGGQAQVVSFNGLVASQATNEVLQLLVGFAGSSINPNDLLLDEPDMQRGYRKLDGRRGELRDWGACRRAACSHCANLLGAGTVSWGAPTPAPKWPGLLRRLLWPTQ